MDPLRTVDAILISIDAGIAVHSSGSLYVIASLKSFEDLVQIVMLGVLSYGNVSFYLHGAELSR